MIWVTKDGRVMDVRDMTDSHLANALAMMDRRLVHLRANERAAWVCYAVLQGDMAQYYCEQDCNRLTAACAEAETMLGGLKGEQRRRERAISSESTNKGEPWDARASGTESEPVDMRGTEPAERAKLIEGTEPAERAEQRESTKNEGAKNE